MRNSAVLCFTLLSALASSHLSHAQFLEPTKDELSMTADPKAPGAAAVILNRDERTDDTLHYHGIYERIKVLTEKGKEAATIRVPYEHGVFKVTDIQGRTIHADGSIVPLTAKPSDLVDVKNKDFQVNTMVFTLPSVEVGSILEYRLQIRYDDQWISSPTWDVQRPYFVHKAHYFFQPSHYENGLLYAFRGKPDTKIVRDSQGRFMYDVVDVPAVPSDDWMPPTNSMTYRIEFYYSEFVNGNEFWQNAGKKWAKDSDHFANPSRGIQQAVAQIVAPGDTDDQKARKIYDAVQKLDNTSFTRSKSKAERKAESLKDTRDAEIAWNQKSGSANELALLYVALARAAGLQAYPMQVVNRDRAVFDPNYLTTWQLDDYIAVVTVNGKDLFLDPGQKMCPYGLLHWKHTLAGGLRGTPKGATFAATPANTYVQNTVQRIADLSVAADGNVTGSLRFVFNGQDAMRWRQAAVENDEDEVKKRFNEWARENVPDGIDAEFDHFLALDEFDSNLIAIVKVSGVMGTATGKHYFLPGVFFESRATHPFASQDKRTVPVDVHFARRVTDQVTYRLPAGFTVESAPADSKVPWQGNASLRIVAKSTPDTVTVARDLAYNFTIIDAKDYAPLHDFYQKVATADQQQLVLTRSAQVAKSN